MHDCSTASQELNLAPQHFTLWLPPVDHCVHFGPEQTPVPLPNIPLPLNLEHACSEPSDNNIGAGVYDYLRRFPACPHNTAYAELLRDAYPHYLADMAAHLVLLDAKDVEPSYVVRKLNGLRILLLLEPGNRGLLWQLAQGYYDLALCFAELPRVRQHLLDAMSFGLQLVRRWPDHPAALNLLAEIDLLFGDYPSAVARYRRLLPQLTAPGDAARIAELVDACVAAGHPDHPRIDDLEALGEALRASADEDYALALSLLERLEMDETFVLEFSSADFFFMLGKCRLETGDRAGAFDALGRALEIDPEHVPAREALDSF